MALTNHCTNGLLVLAVVLLPVQYYLSGFSVDQFSLASNDQLDTNEVPEDVEAPKYQYSILDLVFSFVLVLVGIVTYICEWIQRKLLERRLLKLQHYLVESSRRLHSLDAQQDQIETNLKMVQIATSEYKLLLYLLLRRYHIHPEGLVSSYHIDKNM